MRTGQHQPAPDMCVSAMSSAAGRRPPATTSQQPFSHAHPHNCRMVDVWPWTLLCSRRDVQPVCAYGHFGAFGCRHENASMYDYLAFSSAHVSWTHNWSVIDQREAWTTKAKEMKTGVVQSGNVYTHYKWIAGLVWSSDQDQTQLPRIWCEISSVILFFSSLSLTSPTTNVNP